MNASTPRPAVLARRVLPTAIVLGLMVSVFPGKSVVHAAVTYVQSRSATPQIDMTVVTAAYASAQVAGDLNVVVVGWNDSIAQVVSVADTKGNAYVRAVGPTVQTGFATQSIYYAANVVAATAGSNTVTVTFNVAARFVDLRIVSYRGQATVNPVDVVLASQGDSSLSDSGAVTTTNANDLLVAGNLVQTSTGGPGTGFTRRLITSPDGDILEDRLVAATGSYNATAPVGSGQWIMQMVAFRALAAGGDAQAADDTDRPHAERRVGVRDHPRMDRVD